MIYEYTSSGGKKEIVSSITGGAGVQCQQSDTSEPQRPKKRRQAAARRCVPFLQ
jgi:hypothetical protein